MILLINTNSIELLYHYDFNVLLYEVIVYKISI